MDAWLSSSSPCFAASPPVTLLLHNHRLPPYGTLLARLPHVEPFFLGSSSVLCSRSIIHRPRAFDSLDLELPPIDYDLQAMLRDVGAEFSEDGVVLSFGNDGEALESVTSGVSVAEMSHIGRLRVTGDDRIRFLHNQTTADFQLLKEGEGCNTVFVSPTARTIDLATAWVMKRSIILFTSQDMRQHLLQLLNKYIFFADKVEIEDITEKTLFFTITGPKSDQLMEQLNMKDIVGKPYGTHLHYAMEGTPVTVGVGNMLSKSGYSLLLSTDTASLVWETLLRFGAVPMGANCWEHLRIQCGRPAAGKELTEEFNVLEAGLWETISLSKGCYIGQETIARLITYKGVKQHLWGLILDGYVDPGSAIFLDGIKIGKLTSCSSKMENGSYIGLGYVSKRASGQGLHVQVGERSGMVMNVPFVTQSLPNEGS